MPGRPQIKQIDCRGMREEYHFHLRALFQTLKQYLPFLRIQATPPSASVHEHPGQQPLQPLADGHGK